MYNNEVFVRNQHYDHVIAICQDLAFGAENMHVTIREKATSVKEQYKISQISFMHYISCSL